MALQVTPGPLPEDGTRINVSRVLSDFVRGTTLSNFGSGEFAGADISFLVSATLPPATDQRDRGTMWFERGAGILYKWTLHPDPTGTSGTTEGSWLAMSPRKDMLVKLSGAANAGDTLRVISQASEWKHELAKDGRHTLRVTKDDADPAYADTFLVDPVLVALAAASDGEYIAAVEWGYTNVGVTGTGIFGYVTRDDDPGLLVAGDMSDWTNTFARAVHVVATGSTAPLCFKCPSLSNWIH